jgi:ketosteroid isomerase-like protein
MSNHPSFAKDEAAIRNLIEGWADAVRRKDIDVIVRNHSPGMWMFDVPPPLHLKGIDAYRKSWDLFFAYSPDPPAFEIREMTVTAGADVAFAAALMRCIFIEVNKDPVDLDFRLTIGLRKIDDQWVITHEHHSIPATQ